MIDEILQKCLMILRISIIVMDVILVLEIVCRRVT